MEILELLDCLSAWLGSRIMPIPFRGKGEGGEPSIVDANNNHVILETDEPVLTLLRLGCADSPPCRNGQSASVVILSRIESMHAGRKWRTPSVDIEKHCSAIAFRHWLVDPEAYDCAVSHRDLSVTDLNVPPRHRRVCCQRRWPVRHLTELLSGKVI